MGKSQTKIGYSWLFMPAGPDKSKTLHKAIEAFEAALTVYTREAHPLDWATEQQNIGNSWSAMPDDDRGESLHKAIAAYEAALTVRKKDADTLNWASLHKSLGEAWCKMPDGDKSKNLANAIAEYEAVLTVREKRFRTGFVGLDPTLARQDIGADARR